MRLARFRIASIWLTTAGGAACATVLNARSPIGFDSEPTGATVIVDGVHKGVTPTAVELSKPAFVCLVRPNYEPFPVRIVERLDTKWVFLDILTGVVPLIVDAITRRWYDLTPSAVNARLQPNTADQRGASADHLRYMSCGESAR